MASRAQQTEESTGTTGTTVATRARRELAPEVQSRIDEVKARNAMVLAIRSTQWGNNVAPEVARSVAEYCRQNGLDPVRHVEVLGGRIYLSAEFYDERGAALIRAGVVIPDEPDVISADARLDDLAAKGDEWAIAESTRRIRERIKHGVPEKSLAAVVQRFRLKATGEAIIGVNWCGGNGRKDPVGDAEPTKTATTRARRRAWKQIADVIPEYGRIVKPAEATARIASEQLPVSVVAAPDSPPIALPPANDPYGNGEFPEPPARHADDPGARSEDFDEELSLDDGRTTVRGGDALRDG